MFKGYNQNVDLPGRGGRGDDLQWHDGHGRQRARVAQRAPCAVFAKPLLVLFAPITFLFVVGGGNNPGSQPAMMLLPCVRVGWSFNTVDIACKTTQNAVCFNAERKRATLLCAIRLLRATFSIYKKRFPALFLRNKAKVKVQPSVFESVPA